MSGKQRDALRRLGALLDRIDAETRQEGEPSLRHVVAEHAREELSNRTEGENR
jgi:hypothetical protein